jgi:hypothetical protein
MMETNLTSGFPESTIREMVGGVFVAVDICANVGHASSCRNFQSVDNLVYHVIIGKRRDSADIFTLRSLSISKHHRNVVEGPR